jgi:toxin ParE1/3/4
VLTVRFSRLAEADLLAIGEYTLNTWGEDEAIRYLDELEGCRRLLSGSPQMGKQGDDVRPGLRRVEHGSHVVFDRHDSKGVQVCRILHRRMLPDRHAIEDEKADQ